MRLLTDLAVVLRLVLYPPQTLHSHRDCQVAMVGRLLDIFRHGKWTALTRQCSPGLDLTDHGSSQLATTAGGIVFILCEFCPPHPSEAS